MIQPGQHPFVARKARTFDPTLTWKGPGGTPVDLTGYAAKMQVRVRKELLSAVILELSTGNGRITLGGALGTIALLVSDEDMDAIEVGRYYYDLRLDPLGGTEFNLLEGPFFVKAVVTN